MHNIHQSKRNTTHLLHSTRSPVTSINNIYTAHTHTHTHTLSYTNRHSINTLQARFIAPIETMHIHTIPSTTLQTPRAFSAPYSSTSSLLAATTTPPTPPTPPPPPPTTTTTLLLLLLLDYSLQPIEQTQSPSSPPDYTHVIHHHVYNHQLVDMISRSVVNVAYQCSWM